MDDEVIKTRENIKLYMLSDEEREEELNKFQKLSYKLVIIK